jgi:hypothetical protein
MHRAKQEIFSVDVIDINHIRVRPTHGPGLNHHERIAAVLELWRASDNDWMTDRECMLPAKIGPETVIRNVSALLAFTGVRLMFVPVILTRRILFRFAVLVFFFPVLVCLFAFFVLFVLVGALVVLPVLLMSGLSIRLSPLIFLRMRLVLLRVHGHGKPQKYSQCGRA